MNVHPSIDVRSASFRIARAFCRQRYPLADEGLALREEALSALVHGQLSKRLVARIPVVENPRLELFKNLDLTEREEAKYFGSRLACIVSGRGCTHLCTHCYEDAPLELTMTPFAALLKMAEAKRRYEQRVSRIWPDWVTHLREQGCVDLETWDIASFLKKAEWEDLECLARQIKEIWKTDPLSRVAQVKRFPTRMPVEVFKQLFSECLPLGLGSVLHMLYTFLDSDPLDYRDYRFLHLDGSPADYGDVFAVLSTEDRPIVISTAGWFSDNQIACRAMQKIIALCQQEPLLYAHLRISVSPWEIHARIDQEAYILQIAEMVRQAAPLAPTVQIYHNDGERDGGEITQSVASYLANVSADAGSKGIVGPSPVSHLFGRSQRLAKKHETGEWDPFDENDGYFILHDGEVREQVGARWTQMIEAGSRYFFFRTPCGRRPRPRNKWLYKLEGAEA